MKKVSIVINDYFLNNKLFDLNISELLYPAYKLRQVLLGLGYDLSTYDRNSIEESAHVIYEDINLNKLPDERDKDKSFLSINECNLIHPDNWNRDYSSYFNKIFLWKTEIVDNKKYFYKAVIPNRIQINEKIEPFERKKLITLVNSNKMVYAKNELYSERQRIINWYEKNDPDNFDFYGYGWEDIRYFTGFFGNVINTKLKFLSRRLIKDYACYKGTVGSKRDVLSKYKFVVCYENGIINDYITEKIFDCFCAGSVPIYYGASNIHEFIPEDTFVDYRNFSNYSELDKYLKSMTKNEYIGYLDRISEFLKSEKVVPFSTNFFIEQFVKAILNIDLKLDN